MVEMFKMFIRQTSDLKVMGASLITRVVLTVSPSAITVVVLTLLRMSLQLCPQK